MGEVRMMKMKWKYDVEHDDLGVEPKEKIEPKHVDVQLVNPDDQEVFVAQLLLQEDEETQQNNDVPDVTLDNDVPIARAVVNLDGLQS